MSAPTPPPGWYPDPAGGTNQRWWDGDTWAESTPTKPAKPGWSKELKASAFVGGSIVVVIIAAAAIGLTNNDGGRSVGSANGVTSTQKTTGLGLGTANSPEISEQQKQAAEAARRVRLDPANYQPVTERSFALIAKDPNAHRGEKVVVYGEVTQFDAATGTTEFRANTGALPPGNGYYSENTFITAAVDPSIVADVVNKDLLKMYVEVVGAYSYDTTLGGNTTVPKFQLNIVEHLGQAS